MGNRQSSVNVDNKFLQSSFTLKQHSNMPPSNTKRQKKVRFNLQSQSKNEQLTIKSPNKPQSMNYLDIDYRQKQPRFKFTDSVELQESKINMKSLQLNKNESQNQLDSLRVTHIDAETKKSNRQNTPNHISTFFDHHHIATHKSMLHQKAQIQPKNVFCETKQLQSHSECRDYINCMSMNQINPYSSKNKGIDYERMYKEEMDYRRKYKEQMDYESKHKQEIKMRIPSSIDDIDTIQLNQSNPAKWLKSTIRTSQNTIRQMKNENFQQRGYFIPTDTQKGKKVIQLEQDHSKVPTRRSIFNIFGIQNKNKEQQTISETSTQCECSLVNPFVKLFSFISNNPKSQETKQTRNRERLNQHQNQFELPVNKMIQEKTENMKKVQQKGPRVIVSKSY